MKHILPGRLLLKLKDVVRRHLLIVSMIYSFCMFLIVFLFAYPKWAGADDFLISGILSGVSGESSPYVLVISYPLAVLLCVLEFYIPQLNWLTMLELFSVWSSFSVFIWILLKKKQWGAYFSAIFLPIIFEISLYLILNYTISACLLAFTGVFLVYYGSIVMHSKVGTIIGIILALLGSLLRFSCFFLVIPYVGIWFVMHLWTLRKEKLRDIIKRESMFLVGVFSLLLLVLIGYAFHMFMYDKFDSSNNYRQFNQARAGAYDYLLSDYKLNEEAFLEIGISYNDYIMVNYNMINDDFFDEDTFEKIMEINKKDGTSFSQKLGNFSEVFWNNLTYYHSGIRGEQKNIFPLFVISALLSLIFIKKKTIFPFVCILGGTFLIAVYFIWTGRFPPWVQDSLYLIGIFSFLYGTDWNIPSIPRLDHLKHGTVIRKWITYVACFSLLAGGTYLGTAYFFERAELGEAGYVDHNVNQALLYMEEQKDNVYIIDNFAHCPYPIVDAYGSLRGLVRGSWSNIVRVGTWFLEHPVMNEQLETLNLDSPIRNLVDENVYLFTNTESKNLTMYQIFFEEHYQMKVQPLLVEQWGTYAIYSFKVTK